MARARAHAPRSIGVAMLSWLMLAGALVAGGGCGRQDPPTARTVAIRVRDTGEHVRVLIRVADGRIAFDLEELSGDVSRSSVHDFSVAPSAEDYQRLLRQLQGYGLRPTTAAATAVQAEIVQDLSDGTSTTTTLTPQSRDFVFYQEWKRAAFNLLSQRAYDYRAPDGAILFEFNFHS